MSSETESIRFLAVDDHPLIWQGIAGLVATLPTTDARGQPKRSKKRTVRSFRNEG